MNNQFASQTFTADSEARLIVKMLHAVDRASHSIGSAFDLGYAVYLSSDEIVAKALENVAISQEWSHSGSIPSFTGSTDSDSFNRYWTGGGTGFAWRVWEADGAWHAEARISHRTGEFTPQSTLLKACETAGFSCNDVHSDFSFHNDKSQVEALDSAVIGFLKANVHEIRVPYIHGAHAETFLNNLRAYVAICETVFAERAKPSVWENEGEKEDEDNVLIGVSTLSKLRAKTLKFDDTE